MSTNNMTVFLLGEKKGKKKNNVIVASRASDSHDARSSGAGEAVQL